MSTSVELSGFQKVCEPPAKPLDDVMWRAWVDKGRARERRNSARRFKIVKLLSIVVLLATAAFWSSLAPFDLVIRFLVAIGSVVTMLQAFAAKYFAFAVLFAALALLYNPVVPVFGFVGDWQRVLVAASAIPFITSLASRDARTAQTN